MLDQTFPRNPEELKIVGVALGTVYAGLESKEWVVIFPDIFEDFLDSFDWEKSHSFPLLKDIYSLLSTLIVTGRPDVFLLNTNSVKEDYRHPVPSGCSPSAAVELWSEQIGKVYLIHQGVDGDKPFIGIACERAFAGLDSEGYASSDPAFPLVGPSNAKNLASAFVWDVDNDLHRRDVAWAIAKKNMPALDGHVENPSSGGSHYRVNFPGARRPYVLDRNDDPQPDDYLKQIVEMVHLPFEVIKHTLLNGSLPTRQFRLQKWAARNPA